MKRTEDASLPDEELDPALEAAYDALEAGRPDEALVEAARSADPIGRALLECSAFTEMGMLKAAHGALERASEALGEDHPTIVELTGEIALSAWDFDTAQRSFESVREEEEDEPAILERLALLADHRGDYEVADGLLGRTLTKLDDQEFDSVVSKALESLQPNFRERLVNVRVVREPVPFRELIDPGDPAATPPDILGLFVGQTILEGGDFTGRHSGEADLPPTIYLFRRNLERATETPEELAEEIRITLFHEIGHLLGLDEDEVAGMGLA